MADRLVNSVLRYTIGIELLKIYHLLVRLSRNSGRFNLLEHKAFIQASTGIANVITHPRKF